MNFWQASRLSKTMQNKLSASEHRLDNLPTLRVKDLEPQQKLQFQLLLGIVGNRNLKIFSDPF